ncbi:MAG: UDP-3-O-(3-hydroxymyristoyl)glucosamine N-acyltransferase [Bacteroidetes bacterium]|nr:UDP-3-O-(3-hydroxymyristoyl)glucosamine N-acyltransferase [Bacteroidota bacterium]MBU1717700.1 UDP-3-O-(3-hydroxymyristoyl)glucosamine N-acyltransferase [Bacteroidota bacterium]
MTIHEIAQIISADIEGNAAQEISGLAKIEEATSGTMTFLANPKYEKFIYSTSASAVVVSKDFKPQEAVNACLLKVDDPYSCFVTLLELFNSDESRKTGIENPCFIDSSAQIGEGCFVGAFSYIEADVKIGKGSRIAPQCFIGKGTVIGENVLLHPGAKVYAGTVIGNRCIVHSGAVIGSDGFGFAPKDGAFHKIPQTGNVIIEDDVEIGANTTIDRATIGSTVIRKGAKIDNLVMVAHNVEVGEHTVIAGQAGIAGSSKTGKYCVIGGQVGVAGHLNIADKVMIQAQSGIASSIKKEGEILQGSPALPIYQFKKSYVYFRNLEKMEARLRDIEKKNED